MSIFSFSYVCFVPDSQLVFPSIFLADLEHITHPSCRYKECFELMQQNCDYLIMPSNVLDFSNIILTKFRNFLRHIESEIQKARNQNLSEEQFHRNTRGLLASYDYGDLMLYWDDMKKLFWSFVQLDQFMLRRKLLKITLEKMGLFNRICENHEVNFSEEEQKLSEGLYQIIRRLQKEKQIESSANESDLTILADCLIYNGKRFSQQGIMYLVTGDKELFAATDEIIEKPRLILDCLAFTEKISGFRPLKPDKFIQDFKKTTKK